MSEPKTEKYKRTIPVPDALAAILLPLRQLPDVLLFTTAEGSPLSTHAKKPLWYGLMTAAGLATDGKPNFTPHMLRHNYITMCYESGIDAYTAMRLAGHADIETALNIYTHLTENSCWVQSNPSTKCSPKIKVAQPKKD